MAERSQTIELEALAAREGCAASNEEPRTRQSPAPLTFPFAAALLALYLLYGSAPDYLFRQGFPLDDAWIHAVYARELARSGMLAYNPGIPATGETSPLWAVVLAPVHALSTSVGATVASTKILGFALHCVSVCVLAIAMTRAGRKNRPIVWAGAAVAMLHPDLVSASVSGMEVPLATLAVALAAFAAVRGSSLLAAFAALAATLSRPETAVIAISFPLFFWIRTNPLDALKLSAAAVFGAVGATVALGIRNYSVSGMFLPATFHAKVSTTSRFDLSSQALGFELLLGRLPMLDSLFVIVAILAVSSALLVRQATSPSERAAAALSLSGILFCVASFVLIRPVDPAAFYHQRYVLPGVFLLVSSFPVIALTVVEWMPRRAFVVSGVILSILLVAILVRASPARYRHLSNDALNIDDVQVAFGRALESARRSESAWVIDAGASRFFGRAFVVDLMGLNTPEILGQNAQAYLDSRPPAYLDLFPGWSMIQSDVAFPRQAFETSTGYTVTSNPRMRQHMLVFCEPPGAAGRVTVRRGTFTFRCAQ